MAPTPKVGVGERNNGLYADQAKISPDGEVQSATRIFSPRGSHLIAMIARTERAKGFRR